MLGITAGATLCCMEDYKAMPDWANALGRKARERFGCGRENGLIVGKHYVLDIFHADGHYERFPALVKELLQRVPAVIMAGTIAAVRAAQHATRTVSIVMTGGYPVPVTRPGWTTSMAAAAQCAAPAPKR